MSRSYKKTPGFTDYSKRKRFYKRYSCKLNRKDWTLPSGNAYKKNGLSWSICDWKFLFHTQSELDEVVEKNYYGARYKLFTK